MNIFVQLFWDINFLVIGLKYELSETLNEFVFCFIRSLKGVCIMQQWNFDNVAFLLSFYNCRVFFSPNLSY